MKTLLCLVLFTFVVLCCAATAYCLPTGQPKKPPVIQKSYLNDTRVVQIKARNFHLEDCSVPGGFIDFKTTITPTSLEATRFSDGVVVFYFKRMFCLTDNDAVSSVELPFKIHFDLLIGYVKFQTGDGFQYGLIIAVDKFGWNSTKDLKHMVFSLGR